MKLTSFDKAFERTINELQIIQLRAMVVNSFINQNKERIESDARVGHELVTGGLSFRDITLPKGQANLFLNPNYYRLTRNNLSKEVEMIMSREFLLYVAQAYEVLESYLYDQVGHFILTKSTFHLFVEGRTNSASFNSIRKALKLLDDRNYNRHLQRILRANSVVFARYEKENIYDIDYREWMEMLGLVRHCITHKRMEIADIELNQIKIQFDRYFHVRHENEQQLIFLQHDCCSNLLTNIADYVYFIYKSILDACYNQEVTLDTIWPILSHRETLGYLDPVERWLADR